MNDSSCTNPILVYSHGWAMDQRFWGPLRSQFTGFPDLLIGPNYYASSNIDSQERPQTAWVGIGHSLGFRNLIEGDLTHCKLLVSIAGFQEFCGKGGTPQRHVKRMVKSFSSQPRDVLASFYQRCGVKLAVPDEANLEVLARDLERLLDTPEATTPLDKLNGVPVFAIAGQQDKIVPPQLSKNQFSNLLVNDHSGHSLGWMNSSWCAGRIKEYLERL